MQGRNRNAGIWSAGHSWDGSQTHSKSFKGTEAILSMFLIVISRIWTQCHSYIIPVVPHKAVAEVSKIGNLWERLVVVNQEWSIITSNNDPIPPFPTKHQ